MIQKADTDDALGGAIEAGIRSSRSRAVILETTGQTNFAASRPASLDIDLSPQEPRPSKAVLERTSLPEEHTTEHPTVTTHVANMSPRR